MVPSVGLLTGTGLSELVSDMQIAFACDYADLPNFPISTVESHPGRLLIGTLKQRPIIAMQGRFHLYEGYSPAQVTFPVRVMRELGVRRLMVSNAAGGLNPSFAPGDIMVIDDHINLTGTNALIGPNDDSWGKRFPDMGRAYDPDLSAAAVRAARDADIRIQRGVYVGLTGPSLETPAEIRFLRHIGADAVGFSTVQEVIAAVHTGIKVLGLSTITNVHRPENPEPADVAQIIAVARNAVPALKHIIEQALASLDDETEPCPTPIG
jgi:purine-nucleoside phosphorylase